MVRNSNMQQLVKEILESHNKDYSNGLTENVGASIDAISLVSKLVSHKRYIGSKKASAILAEIESFEVEHNALKYAKPLSKFAQNTAYHSVRKALV